MAARSAYDLVKDAIKLVEKQDISSGEKALLTGLVCVHVISHVVESLSRDGTDADRAQLKSDIIKIFHEVVSPLDIPGLPNIVEPYIDNAIETGVAASLDVVLSRLDSLRKELDDVLSK